MTPDFPAAPVPSGLLPRDLSPLGMFMAADIVVQAVMAGLILASVASWGVGLAKMLELRRERRLARRALILLDEARSLEDAASNLGGDRGAGGDLIRAALAEAKSSEGLPGNGAMERAAVRLSRIEAASARRLGAGGGVLATIGSVAPFVGLFGTVWGIMNSFIGISRAQTTNLTVVAPGIAEALLATALGLVAAIPAVVLYNLIARGIAGVRLLTGDMAAMVLVLLSRDLDRREQRGDGLV